VPARHSLGSSYAEIIKEHVVAGLTLAECEYPSGLEMPRHWHDFPHFYFVLLGACTEANETTTRLCKPWSLIFLPAGAPHSNHYHDAGTRTFDIQLEPCWLSRLREHPGGLDHPWSFVGGLPAQIAARIYTEFQMMDTASPLAIEGLALELLAQTTRCQTTVPDRKPPRWLREARELLNTQFAEKLSLEAIAQAVGVHPTHLAREFRRRYRCTVGQYIRDLRIEGARRELSTSDAPVAEIALAAGFSDQSHFTRVFKRHTGLTPTEFRRSFSLR
jgi:AraC family transcriptional regulator